MGQTISGRFDGKVIIPDEPVRLPVGKQLRIRVELAEGNHKKKRPTARKIIGAGQFASGIPDLSTNKKYMEGFGRS